MDTHTDVVRPESNRGSDQGLQQNGKRQYGRDPLRSLTGELGNKPTLYRRTFLSDAGRDQLTSWRSPA